MRAALLSVIIAGAVGVAQHLDTHNHDHHHHHAGEQTHCAHDEDAQISGGVRNSGYFFSPQQYAEGERGRRAQTAPWKKMRITVEYSTTSALSSEQDTFLRNKLVPTAVAWIEKALSVVPLAAPLLVAPFCQSSWPSCGVCYSHGAQTCGLNADGSRRDIPSSILAGGQTCNSCFTDGSTADCTASPAGPGVAGSDFHLFVAAVQTSSCGSAGSGTVAYAGTCVCTEGPQNITTSHSRPPRRPGPSRGHPTTQRIGWAERGTVSAPGVLPPVYPCPHEEQQQSLRCHAPIAHCRTVPGTRAQVCARPVRSPHPRPC